jgi:DNA (cytosine-5)-methyltransferase 1
VFAIAIFDPATASRCPDPLLPFSESLPGHIAKGKPKGKGVASETSTSFRADGAWWDGGDTAEALTTTSNEQRMPDKQRFQAVVEQNVVGALAARDYKGVGNQYVAENKCVVEPYVKSSRAQTSEDSETWIPSEVNPTLNSFDVGDTRATTAIVEPVLFENSYRDGARIANDGVSQTLTSKMGTGGGNTPMIAIGIQGNVIGRQDHNGPAGKGHTEEGEPMFTLTSTDVHAVASTMAVRRLTPLECERLMGWPDHHTRYKADGTEQADTHRYKQCGNGVASPVAQWIAKHILAI